MNFTEKKFIFNTSLFFLGIAAILLLSACEQIKEDFVKLKGVFKLNEHCAVVMESETSFLEYCFPDQGELKKFKTRVPKYTDPYNPTGQYKQLKSTGAGGVIRRINLDRCPEVVGGRGIIYAWSTDYKPEDLIWKEEELNYIE